MNGMKSALQHMSGSPAATRAMGEHATLHPLKIVRVVIGDQRPCVREDGDTDGHRKRASSTRLISPALLAIMRA